MYTKIGVLFRRRWQVFAVCMVSYLVSLHQLVFLENQSADIAFPAESYFMWLPPDKANYCVLVLALHFLCFHSKPSLKNMESIREKGNVSQTSKSLVLTGSPLKLVKVVQSIMPSPSTPILHAIAPTR